MHVQPQRQHPAHARHACQALLSRRRRVARPHTPAHNPPSLRVCYALCLRRPPRSRLPSCPSPADKVSVLREMIFPNCEKLGQTIIFVRTKDTCRRLHAQMQHMGYKITSIQASVCVCKCVPAVLTLTEAELPGGSPMQPQPQPCTLVGCGASTFMQQVLSACTAAASCDEGMSEQPLFRRKHSCQRARARHARRSLPPLTHARPASARALAHPALQRAPQTPARPKRPMRPHNAPARCARTMRARNRATCSLRTATA